MLAAQGVCAVKVVEVILKSLPVLAVLAVPFLSASQMCLPS